MKLPHGARGLRIENIAIVPGNDKIVILLEKGRHLTIQLGKRSGIFDIHETIESPKSHRTLFRSSRKNFDAMLAASGEPIQRLLLDILRPLRPGWMRRQKMLAVYGLHVSDDEIARVTVIRRRKLEVDAALVAANLSIPEYTDELYDSRHPGTFAIYQCDSASRLRHIGTGFRIDYPGNDARLLWVSTHDLMRKLPALQAVFRDTAKQYAEFIEPEPWF